MKQDERCTRCGGEIFPNAGEQWPDGWIHSEPNNCYLTALARAEAAEAEAARLRDENAEAWFAFDRQQSRGDRLAARVAELEAQLAAQQWRPVTEKPPAPDWYQVGDIGVGVYDLWYSGEAWHRSSFQGATYRTPPMSAPDYWRPIPPLPPAPQETE